VGVEVVALRREVVVEGFLDTEGGDALAYQDHWVE
jgi:hypothetical protein